MIRSDSPYFAFGSILAFIATAMFVAAVASPDWYEMHSGANHFRVGYFRVCNTSGGPIPKEVCSDVFSNDFCGHTSDEMSVRQGIGASFGLLGSLLMLFIVVLLLLAWCFQKTGCILYTALVLAAISIAGFIVSIVLIANTFESWYYCGKDYCQYQLDLYNNASINYLDCVTFQGYSFVYAIIAILAAVMCFFTILALLIQECLEDRRDSRSTPKRRRRANRGHDESFEEERMIAIEDSSKRRNLAVASGHSPFHDNRLRHDRSEEDPYHINRTTDDVHRERSTPSRANRISTARVSPARASPGREPAARGSPARNPIVEEITRSPSTPARRRSFDEPTGLNNLSAIPSDQRGGGGGMPNPQSGDEDGEGNKLGYWPSDWVFHPQSKLYWSTSQQLYLDPASEHYYDPHSGKWYDPKRDVWYSKDE
jgi:hypothetical protein